MEKYIHRVDARGPYVQRVPAVGRAPWSKVVKGFALAGALALMATVAGAVGDTWSSMDGPQLLIVRVVPAEGRDANYVVDWDLSYTDCLYAVDHYASLGYEAVPVPEEAKVELLCEADEGQWD